MPTPNNVIPFRRRHSGTRSVAVKALTGLVLVGYFLASFLIGLGLVLLLHDVLGVGH